MFSIYTLKSAKEATKYYQKDNYYTKEELVEVGLTAWYGKGAKILGLVDKLDHEQFKQKLRGRISEEVEMIQLKNGGHHRPGYDLTFSAPKSVSILGIVGKDENVILAHRKAVASTLDHIEAQYGAVRSKINGKINIEKTDNLTFALFEHTDSRELDPNLHTHCILMNFTQRKDGQWRTVYGDDLYAHKIMLGMMYRASLAKELMAMGYHIVQTSEKGTFELEGFDQKLLQQFSKRRQQITGKLADMGQEGGKAAKMANFLTRKEKKEIDLTQIQAQWKNELQCCGCSIDWLQRYSLEAKERGPVLLEDTNAMLQKSVSSAIRHLSEKKAVFSMDEIFKASFGMSIIRADKGALLEEISNRIGNGDLLHVGKNHFTTQAIREKEMGIALNMRQDKNKVQSLHNKFVAGFIGKVMGHEDVLKQILTSADRQIGLQSHRPEDFYALITSLKNLGKQFDYYPISLTNNMRTAHEIKAKTGLNRVHTIQGFLESCEQRAEKGKFKPASKQSQYQAKQLWIIDTNKVSLSQADKLQTWSKHFGARIIWTAYKDHLSPFFSLLEKHGMSIATLGPSSDKSNTLIETITILQQKEKIHAIKDPQERLAEVTDYYLSLPKESRCIWVVSHADKLRVNQCVREKMIQKNELSHDFVKYKSLQPLFFTEEQKRLVHLYQLNDVVHFKAKDDYFTIRAMDIQKNTLTLVSSKGELMSWQPTLDNSDKVDIYRMESRELRNGDIITWSKTFQDKENSQLNRKLGETAEVVSVENHIAKVVLKNGNIVNMDRSDLRQAHFEYSYAKTLSQFSQNKDNEQILLINANQLPYVDKLLLNSCLQNSEKIRIFCDTVDQLNVAQDKDGLTHLATANRVVAFHQENKLISGLSKLSNQVNEVSGNDALVSSFCKDYDYHLTEPQKIAHEAVDFVCSRLSEREAVFSLKQAKQEAYMLAGLKVSKEDIEHSFMWALKTKLLVEVGEDKVTTQGTTLMEQACLDFVKAGQGTVEPILPSKHPSLKVVEESDYLTNGQKEAVLLALTTTDRVVGIQGVAGAGKTTMLREINKSCRRALNEVDKLTQEAGYRLTGLANTASAKNRMIEATQTLAGTAIPAMTLKKFIHHANTLLTNNPELAASLYGKNQIFVLDETSMVSTRDVFSVLSLVNKLEARLLLVGDVKQLSPIEAGNPWRLLIGSDMKSVAIKENVRFKDPQTVAIMKDLYGGNIEDAISRLEGKTIEIPDRSELLKAMANYYVNQNKDVREKTLVISPRNEDRIAINQEIRALLKREGSLLGDEIKTQILQQKDMTQVEKSSVYSYREGDWVRFGYNDKRLGIQSGDYLQVSGKDLKYQKVILTGKEGCELLWSPHSLPRSTGTVEVYQAEQRALMLGEAIRWKKNDESKFLVNGETAKVIQLNESAAKFCLKNGKIVDIDLKLLANQHWDHAYASTVFVAQGQDVSLTLGLCQGPKPYQKDTQDLRWGDVVMLPGGEVGNVSTLVVVCDKSDNQLTLKGQNNQQHVFNLQDIAGKKWAFYPPFEERKPHELPSSSNMSSFLVQATRGDNFVMFVDYLDYFKKTIDMQSGVKETAMRYMDNDWSKTLKKIEQLTEDVTGVSLSKGKNIANSTINDLQKNEQKIYIDLKEKIR